MDFIIRLSKSKAYYVILVIFYRSSKYAHFTPLRKDFSILVIAKAFITHVIKLNGVPQLIISD